MVEAILNSVAGCVPKDGLGALKAKLEGASALDLKGIGAVRLKNKWVGLFLGSFLPLSMLGADRFYKGDFGLGAVKLAGLVGLMLANTYFYLFLIIFKCVSRVAGTTRLQYMFIFNVLGLT